MRFKVCSSLSLVQLVNVSHRLVGPYRTGAGVNDVRSNKNLCVYSRVLLLVVGFWLCIAGSIGPRGPLYFAGSLISDSKFILDVIGVCSDTIDDSI